MGVQFRVLEGRESWHKPNRSQEAPLFTWKGRPLIRSGPFGWHELIARGGMCEVWSGIHLNQAFPVAIKVIPKDLALELRFAHFFRDEVHAVARLHHPAVVMVFDYGTVIPEMEEQSNHQLRAGAPFLVMELADQTLVPFKDKLLWPQVYPILLKVLDGLAHAHARGVIHRDIKPANLLLFPSQQRVKLTDIGLAHPTDREEAPIDTGDIMGTLAYMAPEQFEARWRDYGPWTDLYALGCTIYTLFTGKSPFHTSSSFEEQRWAHLHQPLPSLHGLDVPPGFDGWLQRMTAKHPRHRFQRAADATWALQKLGEEGSFQTQTVIPVGEITALAIPAIHDPSSIPVEPTMVQETVSQPSGNNPDEHVTQIQGLAGPTEFSVPGVSPWDESPFQGEEPPERPPFPDTWTTEHAEQRSVQLSEVGLGLYGLRRISLVGRESECKQLWDKLRQVQETQQAQAVVLSGPAGCGKSRLTEWLSERSHENLALLHNLMQQS